MIEQGDYQARLMLEILSCVGIHPGSRMEGEWRTLGWHFVLALRGVTAADSTANHQLILQPLSQLTISPHCWNLFRAAQSVPLVNN